MCLSPDTGTHGLVHMYLPTHMNFDTFSRFLRVPSLCCISLPVNGIAAGQVRGVPLAPPMYHLTQQCLSTKVSPAHRATRWLHISLSLQGKKQGDLQHVIEQDSKLMTSSQRYIRDFYLLPVSRETDATCLRRDLQSPTSAHTSPPDCATRRGVSKSNL